jgi:serine/threonine protein kinase
MSRFKTEAEAVAQFRHPNIVAVLEIGSYQDVPYMAMEFVAGGNLKSYLEKNRPTPAEAARLVEMVARGIHVAHEHHIIHRDLKPANILLEESGDRREESGVRRQESRGMADVSNLSSTDVSRLSSAPSSLLSPDSSLLTPHSLFPKIADFGLARQLDRSVGLTTTGTVLGTPGYMSPEQAAGKNAHLQPATDIFSLGVILYEMLTGLLPFDSARGSNTFDEPPGKPSSHNSACPPALDEICLRCLQIEPRDRYESALVLAEDLRQFHEAQEMAEGSAPLSKTR